MKTEHRILNLVLLVVLLGPPLYIIIMEYTEKPFYTTMLTFGENTGRQVISIPALQPARYTLMFDNANKLESGYWLEWDYLALTDGGKPVLEIGKEDGTSDEFCDPLRRICAIVFTMDSTKVGYFLRTLNDGEYPRTTIEFVIAKQQMNSPTLVLSTINSVHLFKNRSIDHFDAKLTLWRGMEVDTVIAKTLSTFWGKTILALLGVVDMFVLFWFFMSLLDHLTR